MFIPQTASSDSEWRRIVASALNNALNGYPFPQADADPQSPGEGYTYFNTATGKVRTYSLGVWNDHF